MLQRLVVGLTDGRETRRRRRRASDLPAAPRRGRSYEIWFVDHGHAVRAGLAHGGRLALTRTSPRGAAVAVTLEPAGGSPQTDGTALLKTETA